MTVKRLASILVIVGVIVVLGWGAYRVSYDRYTRSEIEGELTVVAGGSFSIIVWANRPENVKYVVEFALHSTDREVMEGARRLLQTQSAEPFVDQIEELYWQFPAEDREPLLTLVQEQGQHMNKAIRTRLQGVLLAETDTQRTKLIEDIVATRGD